MQWGEELGPAMATEQKKKRGKLERRVSLKMSPALYEQVEKLAEEERRSVNNLIMVLLEQALAARHSAGA